MFRYVGGILLILTLSGCAEMAHRATMLHGLDCRQEKLVHGQCVQVTKRGM